MNKAKNSPNKSLSEIETKLKNQVDPDFFHDPKSFRALPRVIDILGGELLDHTSKINNNNTTIPKQNHSKNNHDNNPAYQSLKKQQTIIEEAIEHIATVHYSDLHASVTTVGTLTKQFNTAYGQVQSLRQQVQFIRDSLGNSTENITTGNDQLDHGGEEKKTDSSIRKNNPKNNIKTVITSSTTGGGGKSLRELWLKKLECEAVLNLLQKLELIRTTPDTFDTLITSTPCRIASAVVILSQAIHIMFMDDVSQIQALHKIMEQLMMRKQRAEEILWETLHDVLYLRTANYADVSDGGGTGEDVHSKASGGSGLSTILEEKKKKMYSGASIGSNEASASGATSNSSNNNNSHASRRRSHRNSQSSSLFFPQQRRHFVSASNKIRRDIDGYDDISYDSDEDTIFSEEKANASNAANSGNASSTVGSGSKSIKRPDVARRSHTTGSSFLDSNSSNRLHPNVNTPFANFPSHQGRLLPRAMVECELDIEVDEMRCLENPFYMTNYGTSSSATVQISYGADDITLPRYTDPVLALRILIEALAKLGRLDDVERCLAENVEREIRRIAQIEQARTLSRLEKMRGQVGSTSRRRTYNTQSGFDHMDEKLKEFRLHLRSLLKSFGSVILRLCQLAQILRHRITSDVKLVTPSYSVPSLALHSVIVTAQTTMEREVKGFLRACLNNNSDGPSSQLQLNKMITPSMMDASVSNRGARTIASGTGVSAHEQGIFSLGIISDASLASSVREKYTQSLSIASRSTAMRMSAEEYVLEVLCPRTGTVPQVRHALFFRRSLAAWTQEIEDLKKELITASNEDISNPLYTYVTEEAALTYLDDVVNKNLLPMMQDAAVNGTVLVLEKANAFDPVLGSGLFNPNRNSPHTKVEMCLACQGLYSSTGPLFSALHKVPRGGEMYAPLVANLEHAVMVFISRVKQRILQLCDGKKAFRLLEDKNSKNPTRLSLDIEARKGFSQLLTVYFDDNDDINLVSAVDTPTSSRTINPITPSASDTRSKHADFNADFRLLHQRSLLSSMEGATDIQRENEMFEQEVSNLEELLHFTDSRYGSDFDQYSEEDFLKAVSLAHSLLEVSSLLEKRLQPKKTSWGKSVNIPRTLKESIKNIRMNGLRVAKFCRIEMVLQVVRRLSVIYQSSTLTSKDVAHIPTCVNSLGEYLTSTSELIREYGGNKIAAYCYSSLERYIPLFLMQTVRVIALGEKQASTLKISLHGVEAMDRTCSVLYRDLKGATSFEYSFWDEDAAAEAFERAASYVALMELDMEELESYYRNNTNQFTQEDYKIMFSMNGPRRKPDLKRFAVLKDKVVNKTS